MLNKRGQGLSITTIIVAVIGLIILAVIITIFTGKFGAFSEGVESVSSCSNTCEAIGWEKSSLEVISDCESSSTIERRVVSGKYSDIPEGTAYGCCCNRDIN